MDEGTNNDRPAIAVVGGGIGGLIAAISARDHGASVVLVEPQSLGGRGRVDDRRGYLFNRGPRALYVGGPAEQTLVGLGVDVAHGSPPPLQAPQALADGRLHRLPDGPVASLRTSLFTTRERLGMTRTVLPLVRDPGPMASTTSLEAWLDARHARGAPRQFVEAMARLATYINAPDILPADLAFSSARRAATLGVRYLDGGFATIVDQLAQRARARGVKILTAPVTKLTPHQGRWTVSTPHSELDVEAAVVATGGPESAAMLLGHRPSTWSLVGPPATVACLELGVRRLPATRFVLGIDDPTYLSVHGPPASLAPEGHGVIHVMRYRPQDDPMDHDAVRHQLRGLAALVGITDDDIDEERFLSHMVVTAAMPAAAAGGMGSRPDVAVAGHPGLYVAGDWVGPEGLLLDAVAASAFAAGRHAAIRCATMKDP